MCSRKGGIAHFSWLTRLIGHAHDKSDEKRGITAYKYQAVSPDRREKEPAGLFEMVS